jgi:hypothetical protein
MFFELRVIGADDVVINDDQRRAVFARERLKLFLHHKNVLTGLGGFDWRHKIILRSAEIS